MNFRALSLHYCSVFVFITVAIYLLFPAVSVQAEATEAETRMISISGGNGVFSVDNQTILPIYITGEQALSPINALEIEMLADPEAITIDALHILPSHCDERFVIEEVLDTAAGIAYKACGTVSPIAATSSVLVAYLHVTPLRVGTTTITFGAHTNAHAHDGLGTQLIGVRQNLAIVAQ